MKNRSLRTIIENNAHLERLAGCIVKITYRMEGYRRTPQFEFSKLSIDVAEGNKFNRPGSFRPR